MKVLLLFLLSAAFLACGQSQKPKNATGIPATDTAKTKALPQPSGYVSDFEHLFTQNEIQQLDSLIGDFEKRTTIQIAVVTLNEPHTDSTDFDNYTLELANAWGVGQKEKNYGVFIGVSRAFRKIRIQNGLGITQWLSDEETLKIINDHFIPGFKKGNYFVGVRNGLLALMGSLKKIDEKSLRNNKRD